MATTRGTKQRALPGTMAADRERIATAFEEMARVIRAGREGWGMRAVGNATKILGKIPSTSKAVPELLEAFIAHSGPYGAMLVPMLPPLRGREEKSVEGRIVASSERIEGLPKLDLKGLRRG